MRGSRECGGAVRTVCQWRPAARASVERDCNGCHVRLVGDADRIYLRDDRRVRTPAQLQAQVAYCNTQLATGYFPDEEEHVAAWLNQRYYRFKP
jgi:hypothetical protein